MPECLVSRAEPFSTPQSTPLCTRAALCVNPDCVGAVTPNAGKRRCRRRPRGRHRSPRRIAAAARMAHGSPPGPATTTGTPTPTPRHRSYPRRRRGVSVSARITFNGGRSTSDTGQVNVVYRPPLGQELGQPPTPTEFNSVPEWLIAPSSSRPVCLNVLLDLGRLRLQAQPASSVRRSPTMP